MGEPVRIIDVAVVMLRNYAKEEKRKVEARDPGFITNQKENTTRERGYSYAVSLLTGMPRRRTQMSDAREAYLIN